MLVLSILVFALNGCWVNEKISAREISDKADDAPYQTPAGLIVLTEAEIHEKIVGNTLVGPSAYFGPEMAEYLHPDGFIKAYWKDDRSEGVWTVSGSLICMYYPYRFTQSPPRTASMFHCYTLTVDGEIVTYYDQNGRVVEMKSILLNGNARDL
jgi:hypothetical protein